VFDGRRPLGRRARRHKWYRNWALSNLLVETLEELSPRYPDPELDLEELRARLEG